MQRFSPCCRLALLLALSLAACEEGPPSSRGRPDAAIRGDASEHDAQRPDTGTDRDASEDAGPLPDASERDAVVPEPLPCESQAPRTCDEPPPTYADVEPLIEEHCLGCHWGEPGGPWPLTTYEHVAAWTMEIRATMLDCSMPPVDAEQPPMPLEDRQLLLMWVRCRAPK